MIEVCLLTRARIGLEMNGRPVSLSTWTRTCAVGEVHLGRGQRARKDHVSLFVRDDRIADELGVDAALSVELGQIEGGAAALVLELELEREPIDVVNRARGVLFEGSREVGVGEPHRLDCVVAVGRDENVYGPPHGRDHRCRRDGDGDAERVDAVGFGGDAQGVLRLRRAVGWFRERGSSSIRGQPLGLPKRH